MMNLGQKRKELAEIPLTYATAIVKEYTHINTKVVQEHLDTETIQPKFTHQLQLNGNGFISAIYIEYVGAIYAEALCPDTWMVQANDNNKIIMVDLGASEFDITSETNIINFSGMMDIKKIELVTYEPKLVIATIQKETKDEYQQNDNFWASETRTYNVIGQSTQTKDKNKTAFQLKAIRDDFGFFKTKDVDKYDGYFRVNKNKVFMTNEKGFGNTEIKTNIENKKIRNKITRTTKTTGGGY